MSHMSIFNDFDETDDDYHGGIIMDKFTMITVDSAQLITIKVLWILVLMIWGMILGLIQPHTLPK